MSMALDKPFDCYIYCAVHRRVLWVVLSLDLLIGVGAANTINKLFVLSCCAGHNACHSWLWSVVVVSSTGSQW